MKTLFDRDMENERLKEKGIEFICLDRHCPLYMSCPFATRTSYDEGDSKCEYHTESATSADRS